MTQTAVGLIGAGRMGLPIVGHLVRAGFSVQVWDIDPAKRALVEAKGAQWAQSAADLAQRADFVLVCVGYDRDVKELLSEGGALAGVQPGTVIAILSTIHPHTVQALAQALQPRGIEVVDATVCRGGWAADEGTLLSFVGGSAAVVERLKPVLRAYSADIVHTGPVGTAQVAKAVNNLILWSCLVADHEGLALAQRWGVDVETLRGALLTSSSANGALENWGKQTMAWAQDDMAIVAEMADDCGIALPQAGVVREICRTLKPRRYRLEEYGK
jgi:3-hydroxyisobutyrate dehydrogenase